MLITFRTAGLWLVAILCAPMLALAAPNEALQVALRDHASVTSARVPLGDVATLEGGSQALLAAAASIDLGAAPMVGQQTRYSAAEIGALLRRRLHRFDTAVALTGAAQVVVSRASRELDPNALAAAATEHLSALLKPHGGRVALEIAATLPTVEIPLGQANITARKAAPVPLAPRMPVLLDIAVDGKFYRSVRVVVVAKVYQSVFVARRDLPRGANVDSADVAVAQLDVAGLEDPVLSEAAPIRNWRLAREVKSGEVILRRHLPAAPLVLRGDQVKLVSTVGAVMVESQATALENAELGRTIRVQGVQGSAPVQAQVVSAQQVHVQN